MDITGAAEDDARASQERGRHIYVAGIDNKSVDSLLHRRNQDTHSQNNKFRIESVPRKPLVSASLSDIRADTLVVTGSLSLVATALFGGADRLMQFLQAKIPATATAADNRYRQWVFLLSKVDAMRVAQRVAREHAGDEAECVPLLFAQRLPSWRSHWRGDRAYLMPLSILPPLLATLSKSSHFRMIKDPSLRFDTRIPSEVTIENGDDLHAVWRDTRAQITRIVELRREGEGWRLARDECSADAPEVYVELGPQVWLEHLLQGEAG